MHKKYLDLIESYLDGDLTMEEMKAFEQLMDGDAELKKEVLIQQALIEGLKVRDEVHNVNHPDKMALKKLWEEVKTDGKRVKINTKWIRLVGIAASVGLLIWVANSFWYSNNVYSSGEPQTYSKEAFFQPYPMNVLRGQVEDSLTEKLNSLTLVYNGKEYDEAIALLKILSERILPKEERQLYMGISYLAIDSLDQANSKLEPLHLSSGLWNEHARWYLTLSYLEQGKKLKAKELLELIVSVPKHFNQAYARQLLTIIDKNS